MTTDAPTRTTPKAMLWIGRVISAIPVLMMGGMGAFMFFASPAKAVEGMTKYGYPAHVVKPLLIVMITSAVLYAIPQTAALGCSAAVRPRTLVPGRAAAVTSVARCSTFGSSST